MFDKKVVQAILIGIAVFVIIQIMYPKMTTEHSDSQATQVQQVNNPAPEITNTSSYASPNSYTAAITAAAPSTVAVTDTTAPVTASVASGAIKAANAVTTKAPAAATTAATTHHEIVGVDMDEIFGARDQLHPQDLIPKPDGPELYSGLKPDAALNQNFLQNAWSIGIDVTKPKRGYINDLRGARPNPVGSFVWQNPTQFPDLYNKNLGDVS